MSSSFSKIAGLASNALIFNRTAEELGFGSIGEIDRFVFSTYAEIIRSTKHADRPRGAIFVLEPANTADAICTPMALQPLLRKILSETTSTIFSLQIDLDGGLKTVYICTAEDKKSLVSNAWPQQAAQNYSLANNKCVVWMVGITIHVYLNGALYLEVSDVLEGLLSGLPAGFQSLSWDDGRIVFEFADSDLNDRSSIGIWLLPDKRLLRPKPEALIRDRLGNFLRYRLAGYHHHDLEAHVENEGQADISLHLTDGRVLIVEVKWIGYSLIGTRINESVDEIKNAIEKNTKGWLTKFDDTTITSGIRQLVRYYKTGRYRCAYLAVFDCDILTGTNTSCYIPIPDAELSGHSADNFRILRACVDPRSASKRARS